MKRAEVNGRNIEIASTVDAVGLFCPMPVVKLKLRLEDIALNGVVELLADDEGICEDLPAWCSQTGNRLLSLKKNEENIFVAYVEKQRE